MNKPMLSNKSLWERAQKSIPGGVNSPVRAFKSVGGTPVFVKKAKGAYLYDDEDNAYLDMVNSWGPMILGHGREEVVEALQEQVTKGISFGMPTHMEIQMAEMVKSMVPNVDQLRLVNSGTEACMSALRLARGYTGKNKFIKFAGNYHGHADPFLVKGGSGLATFDIQTVPGITAGATYDTLVAPYNDLATVEELIHTHKNDVGAIILEPVAGNMGCIPPSDGFLTGLRDLCNANKIILIFDEVMTGFRLAQGGAQERFDVWADLICFGKVIGGGMPVGAFGGKQEIMDHIAPNGKIYQAGTLSGNPVSVAAGLTTLRILKENPDIYDRLEEKGNNLKKELTEILKNKGIEHQINQVGSMISLHFSKHEVNSFATAEACDIEKFNRFFHHMLDHGIHLPPSGFETWFLSDALTDDDIHKTLEAVKQF